MIATSLSRGVEDALDEACSVSTQRRTLFYADTYICARDSSGWAAVAGIFVFFEYQYQRCSLVGSILLLRRMKHSLAYVVTTLSDTEALNTDPVSDIPDRIFTAVSRVGTPRRFRNPQGDALFV